VEEGEEEGVVEAEEYKRKQELKVGVFPFTEVLE
jgi:hypothetical protein